MCLINWTEFFENAWKILNSNFSTALFGAAFGAIFGSLTVLAIEWFRGHRKVLADINASIAVLSGAINSYLLIKRQHALPIAKEYVENMQKLEQDKPVALGVNLNAFYCPDLDLNLHQDRIFTLADRYGWIIPIIMQAKKTIHEVQIACEKWNEIIQQFREMSSERKHLFYQGILLENGIQNRMFPDTIKNLQTSVDDALYFTDLAMRALDKVGKKALPFWLRKRIVRTETPDAGYSALMPPKNYKEGWGRYVD